MGLSTSIPCTLVPTASGLPAIFALMREWIAAIFRGLFFLLLPASLHAQTAPGGQGQWLWKIRSGAQESSSYLFAVLHHADPAFSAAFEQITPVFQRCGFYAGVWPADAVSRNELMGLILREDQQTIRKEYRKPGYSALDQLVPERLGDDLLSYVSWQPIYLRRLLQDAGRKNQGQIFWEDGLHYLARSLAMPVHLINSPETISELINDIPLEEQLELVRKYGEMAGRQDSVLDQYAGFYVTGDWDGLATLCRETEGEAAALRLLDGLALSTATGILESASVPGGFYTIPAELLGGSDGVLNKLNQLGVELEPVPVSQFITDLKAALPAWMIEEAGLTANPASEPQVATHIAIVSENVSENANQEGVNPLFTSLDAWKATPQLPHTADPFSDFVEYRDLDTSFSRQWIRYQPREKDFTVRLPFTPEIVSNTFRAEGGTVEVQIYLLNDPLSELYYLISRNQYPSPFELSDPAQFFSNAVEGTRVKFDGLVLADRPVSTPLYRGREFVLSLPDARYLRGRILLVNNNLFQIVTIGNLQTAWSDQAEVFLRSFALPRGNVRTWAHVSGARFRARMPLDPVVARRVIQTPGGPVQVDLWSLDDPISNITYFISTSHYPPEVAKSKKEFLERIVSGTVSNLNGTLSNEEKIKTGRHQGRYVEIQTPEKKYRIRFFLEGSDLYQIMSGAEGDKVNSADVEYYFKSFAFQ